MRALVTGASGTVGSALSAALREHGHGCHPWDRAQTAPGDEAGTQRLLDEIRPDVLFHLAAATQPTGAPNEGRLINIAWAGQLAECCAERGIRFVFTSSVTVFGERPGPYYPTTPAEAFGGYGKHKRLAEEVVLQADPSATIARLGWQIASGFHGNQMRAFLEREQQTNGGVRASRGWLPACAFVDVTASVLVELAQREPGTYLVDSNRGWSLFDIAVALDGQERGRWNISATGEPIHDQRMCDPRITVAPLSARLTTLSARDD